MCQYPMNLFVDWRKTSRPLCSAAASVQLLNNSIWLCWNLFQKSFLVWFGWRVVCVAQLICCLRSELWVNLCGRLKCKCRHEGNWDDSQTLKREMRIWTCVYWGENTCREPPFLPLCGCVIVCVCVCVRAACSAGDYCIDAFEAAAA